MGVAYGINECVKCKRTSHTTDGLCRYCGADNSAALGIPKPAIYMCDNCGQEDPPLMKPLDPKSRITACCGAGFTGHWKDGWGKRTLLIGQAVIDEWRKAKQRLIDSGDLPICEWSTKGHYEI